MTEKYSFFPVPVQLLQKHKFCTLDQFRCYINKYEHLYDLHLGKLNRATVKQNFLSLRSEAPFSRTVRFPNGFYIDMDCAKIRTLTKQFFNALCLLDLWEQKEVNSVQANRISIDYMKTVTDANFAFTKFADIIMSTDINHLEENGMYHRNMLEQKYKLGWF